MIKWKDQNICDCICHREGTSIMHMMACCNLCYDTYLTEEGEVIPEKLEPLLGEDMLESIKRRGEETLREIYINFITKYALENAGDDEAFIRAHLEMLVDEDIEVLKEIYDEYKKDE